MKCHYWNTYSLSTSTEIFLGTEVRPLCEQSTLSPVQEQARGQRASVMIPTPPPGMWMPTEPRPPLDTAPPKPPAYGSAYTSSCRRMNRSRRAIRARKGGGFDVVVLDGAAIVAHLRR